MYIAWASFRNEKDVLPKMIDGQSESNHVTRKGSSKISENRYSIPKMRKIPTGLFQSTYFPGSGFSPCCIQCVSV